MTGADACAYRSPVASLIDAVRALSLMTFMTWVTAEFAKKTPPVF